MQLEVSPSILRAFKIQPQGTGWSFLTICSTLKRYCTRFLFFGLYAAVQVNDMSEEKGNKTPEKTPNQKCAPVCACFPHSP